MTEGKTQRPAATLFFGADLEGEAPGRIRAAAAAGERLIALDSAAMGWAARSGLPFTCLEDWLTPDALLEARLKPAKLETAWFAPRRELFTFDGLCLPEFDREALYAYWRTLSSAESLAQALAVGGIRQITVLRHDPPRPNIYFEPGDTHATYWEGVFPGTVRTLVTNAPQQGSSATLEGAHPLVPQPAFLHEHPDLVRDRVAICINPFEVFRFNGHIQKIRAAFNGNVVIIANTHLAQHLDAITQSTGLPALGLGKAGQPRADVAGRCAQGFTELLEVHPPSLRDMLRHTVSHFEAVFRRWVWIQATREYWQRAFAAAPPRLVLVSSLTDSESQLPAVEAARARVPSVCLPHSAGLTRSMFPKSTWVLHCGAVDREAFLRSGIAKERLLGCSDLTVVHEYPVDEIKSLDRAPGRLKLLALMAPTGPRGMLCPVIHRGAQVQGLRCMAAPPSDLAGRIILTLKTHPGTPDVEIVETAGSGAMALLAPLDLPLDRALEEADLVVAMNYIGVAILHCAALGKPLVQLWLDPDVGRVDTLEFADLYLGAGELTRSPDAFWNAVRRFLDEPGYADALRRKSSEHHSATLGEAFPTLTERLLALAATGPTV